MITTLINNSEDQPENRNLKALTNIWLKNPKRSFIGQLSINSLQNNFDFLCSKISSNIDLLLFSETKLDDLFPIAQFLKSGFCKSYRLDRCSSSGSLLLYIKEDMPSHLHNEYKPSENVKCLFKEINIGRRNVFFVAHVVFIKIIIFMRIIWATKGTFLLPDINFHVNISNHLQHLNKGLEVYLKHYDNLLILGALNSELKGGCLIF